MALPVLDGNQTATTLSSVVTGGEHIVAHSVVSLGANAIANITSAVSGSVVSVSNFPASQSTTFGAVTGSVSVLNFPSTQTIAGTVTALLSESLLYPNGATGLTKGIAVGFLESQIANPPEFTIPNTDGSRPFPVAIVLNDGAGYANAVGSDIGSSSLPISGTVTADINRLIGGAENFISIAGESSGGAGVMVGFRNSEGLTNIVGVTEESGAGPLPISGTVTVGNSVTIGSVPNGSLTTRFGTPTTANVSFATSAVTNANRKYLLIQNVTTGSNVITVGIGFTPTTTQGIQLTAGAGITFESSYIPTGAVYVLSSVTASNFTILEA